MEYEIKEEGDGAQKKWIISKGLAFVEVYAFGATVTKWSNEYGESWIWLSNTAKLDGTKAIRGGIPLVFPQFGAPIPEMAQHGFARNNVWSLLQYGPLQDSITLYLDPLDNPQATHDAWRHKYQLQFTVCLAERKLETHFTVVNTGPEAFTFQSLQHTYLNVGILRTRKSKVLRGSASWIKLKKILQLSTSSIVMLQPSANSLIESSLLQCRRKGIWESESSAQLHQSMSRDMRA